MDQVIKPRDPVLAAIQIVHEDQQRRALAVPGAECVGEE